MNTVTLLDGRSVSSDSQEWLKECQLRTILGMPSKKHRQDFLALVQRLRGFLARKKLEAEIIDFWQKTKHGTPENRRSS